MAAPFDVIIGDNWMRQHRAVLDYDNQSIVIHKGGRKMSLSMKSEQTQDSPAKPLREPIALSAAQLRRAVRKRERMFYCPVTPTEDPENVCDEKCAADIQQILKEYGDVVVQGDQLPKPPPERPDLPQAIPLKPGTTPHLSTAVPTESTRKARGRETDPSKGLSLA